MNLKLPISGTLDSYELRPSKIIAIGLNYRAHVAESESVKVRGLDGAIPSEPVLFNKTPNVLIGHGESIVLPVSPTDYEWPEGIRTDYEGELVVVIGKQGRHIAEIDADKYIFGYTCGNDVSQRNLQNSDRSGWFRGKSFDSFGPVGPVVVRSADLKNPQNLDIETRLNGKTVQRSNTDRMIFPIKKLVSYISRQFTLEEGDLIFTGTPSGVGPLKEGDLVEVQIQGIGVLSNPVIREEEAIL